MGIIRQDFGTLGNDVQTQMLIAPVLTAMVADRSFAVGDQFIVNNTLYKITTAVTSGTTLTVGTNCALSDTITQQVEDGAERIDNLIITLSKEEYEALSTEQKNDLNKIYYVYDDESDVGYYELEVTLSSAVEVSGTIRIPASGTDSHINSNCTVIPTSEVKADGSPYGYTSIAVSTGYVTITAGEVIPANTKIGVVIYN